MHFEHELTNACLFVLVLGLLLEGGQTLQVTASHCEYTVLFLGRKRLTLTSPVLRPRNNVTPFYTKKETEAF